MRTTIVIPARYSSKRFPGKPLAILEGKHILERVWEIATFVCSRIENCEAIVATESPSPDCPSDQIIDFCYAKGINIVTTSNKCRSGSDRAWEVVSEAEKKPDIIVNLQGDLPTCPPIFIEQLITALQNNKQVSVSTIYTRLSWKALDELRNAKKQSPFSGTTVISNANGEAVWFSKNIIPSIRDESILRTQSTLSPVLRHIGLYAYRYEALEFFARSKKSNYEQLEQLEQLRFIENEKKILLVEGNYPPGYEKLTSGIDSLEDLERASQVIRANGEILSFYK